MIRLSQDGDQWCALIGWDLQEGVAGFGKTPEEAIAALSEELLKLAYNLNPLLKAPQQVNYPVLNRGDE